MKLLCNDSPNPAFNQAVEEYFLTQKEDDYIILWRNPPAVIVGINQNTCEEIDSDYAKSNDIAVIRRLSGGGAVFHDLGNINFTIIQSLAQEDFNNYAKFTQPVVEFLNKLGAKAELIGRNDLLIGEEKISGNAQAVKGKRIMHHGTLLYDGSMEHLSKVLKPNKAKIESKGIKSVRSRVTNIALHTTQKLSPKEFMESLFQFFLSKGNEEYQLSEEDIASINKLVKEKYSTWEWNFGSSPNYSYNNGKQFPFGYVAIGLSTENGIIKELKISGDFFGTRDKLDLEKLLEGTPHESSKIHSVLGRVNVSDYISGMTTEEFLSLF